MSVLPATTPDRSGPEPAHQEPPRDLFVTIEDFRITIDTTRDHGTITWYRGKDGKLEVAEHQEWF